MQHLRRRLICSTGVIACGLIAACVTAPELSPPQGAATVPARDLKAGQYWEYAVHDAYTGLPRGVYRYTVARLDATQAVVDVIQDGVHVDAYYGNAVVNARGKCRRQQSRRLVARLL